MASACQLLENLTSSFSLAELRTLAFQVAVDWDELEGTAKTPKARELIARLERRGRTSSGRWPSLPPAWVLTTLYTYCGQQSGGTAGADKPGVVIGVEVPGTWHED